MVSKFHIPKIIHQIWIGPHPMPTELMSSWKTMNPDWEYKLWTEQNIPVLYNKKQYNEIKSYAGKADILRLEILFQFGGIYLDADSLCLQPLTENFLRYHFFACYENEKARPGLIANGVIGSQPNHPLLSQLIESVHSIEDVNKDQAWIIVGPMLFTKVLKQYMVFNKPIKIFPSHLFYPVHCTGLSYAGRGKVYAMQYWHTTVLEKTR